MEKHHLFEEFGRVISEKLHNKGIQADALRARPMPAVGRTS